MAVEEIKKYEVLYYAGAQNANGHKYRAVINLKKDGGFLIGAAYFHRDPSTMPATDDQSPSGFVWLHFPQEDFPQVLDLLRNEAPVYLHYVGDPWRLAYITTSQEPVGEGELS